MDRRAATLLIAMLLAAVPGVGQSRQAAADRLTTEGGLGGPLIIVDTAADVVADDGLTSLREALAIEGPRVIELRVDEPIRLERPLHLGGDPRVDPRRPGENPWSHLTLRAPRELGVTVVGAPLVVGNHVTDVVIRWVGFRSGEVGTLEVEAPATSSGLEIGRAQRVLATLPVR